MSESCICNVTLLLKQYVIMDIFRGMSQLFFRSLFFLVSQIFIVLIGLQGQVSWRNRRNILNALRTLVKAHKGLREKESFPKCCSSKKLF